MDTRTTNENIDERVEQWHHSESRKSLHEYLGLTWEAYTTWAETGSLPKVED